MKAIIGVERKREATLSIGGEAMVLRRESAALTRHPRRSPESGIAEGQVRYSPSFVFASRARPNKSPEPTHGAVTPRAIERKSEMAMQTEIRHAARGAPAPRVAHL